MNHYQHLTINDREMILESLAQSKTMREIQEIVNKLNFRPKKCLDWRTPYEVYFGKVLHLI